VELVGYKHGAPTELLPGTDGGSIEDAPRAKRVHLVTTTGTPDLSGSGSCGS